MRAIALSVKTDVPEGTVAFVNARILPNVRSPHPGALPLWGGTDVMVDVNFGRSRPEAILDLTRVRELAEWERQDGLLRVGAGADAATVARLAAALEA